MYNEEKIYSVRLLVVVHILNFQRDHVVMRFIRIELIMCSTSKVERVKVHIYSVGEERGCIGSRWGNRGERDHWGDLGVDGWIILGWISRRWDVGIWTGLGWPRIETGCGRL